MSKAELLSLIVTLGGVIVFSLLFTLLFRHLSYKEIEEVERGEHDIELIDEAIESQKKKGKKKSWAIVSNALFYAVLIVTIPCFVFALINRFSGNNIAVGDSSILVVASGSMSFKNEANPYLDENNLNDQFSQNDIIVIHKVNSKDDIKLYDIIAYHDPLRQQTIIHRVIGIDEADGTYKLTTRGDANNATDAYHASFDDVVGKYEGERAQYIGVFVLFLQSYSGIVTIAAIIYCLSMIDHYGNKIEKSSEERKTQLTKVIDGISEDHSMYKDFKEVVYYQNYAYYFNQNGFEKKEDYPTESPRLKIVTEVGGLVEEEEIDLNKAKENDDGK